MAWGTPSGLQTTSGYNGTAGQTTNVILTKPTGLSNGDTLFAAMVDWQGTGATWTAPSGWTLLKAGNDGASGNCGVRIYGRYVATASGEPASYTWTYAPGAGNNCLYAAAIVRVSGGATTLTTDGTATSASNENSTSLANGTGPTTTVNGDLIWEIWGSGSGTESSASWSTAAGLTSVTNNLMQTQGGVSAGVVIGVFYLVQASSGSVASSSSTLSGVSGSYGNVAIKVALQPLVTVVAYYPFRRYLHLPEWEV